ncbi:MAG: helix-turn-helix transcriptional regulator [Clostridia bacterium]|nr:helix-turn-helix transcriptional regulator [Clostridia bacterium]MDD4375227.1 helix-turn-helix transcriptional regulator [Clostridia bacterium]
MSSVVNGKDLGIRIRKARKEKELTQFALAEEVGVSSNFLGDVERGIKSPSLDTIVCIANVLDVSLDYLLFESLSYINVKEDPEIYVTDKQLTILKGMIKTIKDTFVD